MVPFQVVDGSVPINAWGVREYTSKYQFSQFHRYEWIKNNFSITSRAYLKRNRLCRFGGRQCSWLYLLKISSPKEFLELLM